MTPHSPSSPGGGLSVPFEKLHGARNDFLFCRRSSLPNLQTVPLAQLRAVAQRLCDRHAGLGADGLVLWDVAPESTPGSLTLDVLIINSDGSLAGTCGNALRCLGLLVYRHGLWKAEAPQNGTPQPVVCRRPHLPDWVEQSSVTVGSDERFALQTKATFANLLDVQPTLERSQAQVTVGMGNPLEVRLFPDTAPLLPLRPANPQPQREREENSTPSADLAAVLTNSFATLPQLPGGLKHAFVQLSNPHWVFYSPDFAQFCQAEYEKFGQLAQGEWRKAFPNVPVSNIGMLWPCSSPATAQEPIRARAGNGAASISALSSQEQGPSGGIGTEFQLVVYERGAGLTACCGSGATAARIALETMGLLGGTPEAAQSQIAFEMPGGRVWIGWTHLPQTERTLTGPACWIASGEAEARLLESWKA